MNLDYDSVVLLEFAKHVWHHNKNFAYDASNKFAILLNMNRTRLNSVWKLHLNGITIPFCTNKYCDYNIHTFPSSTFSITWREQRKYGILDISSLHWNNVKLCTTYMKQSSIFLKHAIDFRVLNLHSIHQSKVRSLVVKIRYT